MGGCQNYGPFLGTLNIRGRIIMGIQKGPIILTTTHIISIEPGGEGPNMSSTLQALEEGAQTVLVVAWLKRTSSV